MNNNRIKELRKEQKKTLQQVADGVGVSNGTIANYENGKREPKLETWQKLADYFGVSVGKVMGNLPKVNILEFRTDTYMERFDSTMPELGGYEYWFNIVVEREGVNINPDEVTELNEDDMIYFTKYDVDPGTRQMDQVAYGKISVSDIQKLDSTEFLLKYEKHELGNFSEVWTAINEELAKRKKKSEVVDLWQIANMDDRNERMKVNGHTITQKDWSILYDWIKKSYVKTDKE